MPRRLRSFRHPTRILALAIVALPSSATADATALLADLLASTGFALQDVQDLENSAIARELDVEDRSREAAFAGLIRISNDGSGFADAMTTADFSAFPDSVDAFGRFGDPAAPSDVSALRFPESDIEVLAECRIHQCKFKLGRDGIDDLAGIDWKRGDAGEKFTALFKQAALAYVERYRKDGGPSLITYQDKPEPAPLAHTLKTLVGQFPELEQHAPALAGYLVRYPDGGAPDLSDSIMWSVKDFGYRPTLTIDHVLVEREPESEGAVALAAVNTIYANHYLAGRIQLAAVLDGTKAFGVPGHFVLLVDRIAFDDELGSIKRSVLGRALRSDIESRMQLFRQLAEQ